jgi:hypothetical protein
MRRIGRAAVNSAVFLLLFAVYCMAVWAKNSSKSGYWEIDGVKKVGTAGIGQWRPSFRHAPEGHYRIAIARNSDSVRPLFGDMLYA